MFISEHEPFIYRFFFVGSDLIIEKVRVYARARIAILGTLVSAVSKVCRDRRERQMMEHVARQGRAASAPTTKT